MLYSTGSNLIKEPKNQTKTKNVLINITRIYTLSATVLSMASLGLIYPRGNSTTTTIGPSGCSKKQLMACLSNLLSAFFLSFLLNGPSNPTEMSPDIFFLSTGDYFNMVTRALLLLQTFLANLRAERFGQLSDSDSSWEGAPQRQLRQFWTLNILKK